MTDQTVDFLTEDFSEEITAKIPTFVDPVKAGVSATNPSHGVLILSLSHVHYFDTYLRTKCSRPHYVCMRLTQSIRAQKMKLQDALEGLLALEKKTRLVATYICLALVYHRHRTRSFQFDPSFLPQLSPHIHYFLVLFSSLDI